MWVMIESLAPLVEQLKPVFTQPSFQTSAQLLLAMRVMEAIAESI